MPKTDSEFQRIEQLDDENGELETLLLEEYRYHVLRSEALKRELNRRDIEVD